VNRFGRILSVNLVSEAGKEIGAAPINDRCSVRIRVETFTRLTITQCAMDLYAGNIWLVRARADKARRVEVGIYDVFFRIPPNFLAQTTYSMNVSLTLRRKNDDRDYPLVMYKAIKFMAYAGETPPDRTQRKIALLAPKLDWVMEPHLVKGDADSQPSADEAATELATEDA
jgi:hypothetical protein